MATSHAPPEDQPTHPGPRDQGDGAGERWRRGVASRARAIYESAHGNPLADDARGMRWALDVKVAAVMAVLLLALGGVVVWSLRAPTGVAVGVGEGPRGTTGAVGAHGPAGAAAGSSPSPSVAADAWGGRGQVVVHVAGHVERPGLQVLPAGSRVDDAIQAGGGFLPDAARDDLNLARVLVDGEQVYVPALPASDASLSGDDDGGTRQAHGGTDRHAKINVNRADSTQLEELPGVGPVLAARIEQFREAHGPFIVLGDLQEVSGIGPVLMDKLTEVATV